MIGGEYFPDQGNAFFILCLKSIVNIGWHHESIVPDILEMNWNVRDFFIKLERKVLEKKGEEK